MEDSDDLTAIRRKLIEIEFEAKHNEDFRARVFSEPRAVLLERGIDPAAADTIVNEMQLLDEEALPPDSWCDGITCIYTGCSFFTYGHPHD
jgi:hypothetical protein